MQLVDLGRNEPCPCGSGRKYKKCCLAMRDAAIAADPEIVVAVDRAIENDDWEPLYGPVGVAMPMFERGAPLEHVRFRDDQIQSRASDLVELANRCTAGWLRRCELEIAYVLGRFELDSVERHGLQVAMYLLRRFGAQSPTVEELAKLQSAERGGRLRRFANAVSARGLALEEVMASGTDLLDWVERVRPVVLSFAEWFALCLAPDDRFDELWFSGIAARVADACLDRAEDRAAGDRGRWLSLAAVTLLVDTSLAGRALARFTPPRQVTASERIVYEAIQHERLGGGEEHRGMARRIVRETEEREEFAGAALLRATIQGLQIWRRDRDRPAAHHR